MHPAIIIGTVRSLIVDVAMGQIPRSTERISSWLKISDGIIHAAIYKKNANIYQFIIMWSIHFDSLSIRRPRYVTKLVFKISLPLRNNLILSVGLSHFYRAACNADAVLWGDFCPSVRLSVCLSVTRVDCDKPVEKSVQIYIPYEKTFSLVFWEDRMVGGGRPLLPEILGQPTPIGTKSPIFNQ